MASIHVGDARHHRDMTVLDPPDETDPDDPKDEPDESTGSDLERVEQSAEPPAVFDPFAGIDVGRIMPSIDFAQYLPKMDFSDLIPKVDTAIFETLANIDFGTKPIIDAAILKSLDNLLDTKSLFPPGLFTAFAEYKFPDLDLHPDALRAINSLTIAPSYEPLDVEFDDEADEVIEAEIIDDEPGTELEARAHLVKHASLQTELLQETVKMLRQSMEDAARARKDASESRDARHRAENSKWIVMAFLGLATLGVTAMGVYIAVSG